jgi:hypothetical protein
MCTTHIIKINTITTRMTTTASECQKQKQQLLNANNKNNNY